MKSKNLLACSVAIAGAALLTACDSQTKPRATGATELPLPVSESQAPPKSAPAATAQPAPQSREEYITYAERKLASLEARIADLMKKSELYTGEAKVRAEQTIEELRTQRTEVWQELEDARNAQPDGWDKARMTLNSGLDELEKAFDKAKTIFK